MGNSQFFTAGGKDNIVRRQIIFLEIFRTLLSRGVPNVDQENGKLEFWEIFCELFVPQ